MSKYKVSDDVLDKIFNLFIEVIGRSKNKTHIYTTMFDILSPIERLMLAKRITIMYLVRKGIDYDIICRTLKVSSSTVSKYVFLLERSKGIKSTLDILINDDHMVLFFKELFGLLYRPDGYKMDWKAAKKFHKKIEREKTYGI
jgi:uncharacterized protein YerC